MRPHSHPDSAWSGVYYVDADSSTRIAPLSGVLEFLDPRVGVEAVSTPGDPYGEPVRVRPETGCLLPSRAGSITGAPLRGPISPHRGFVNVTLAAPIRLEPASSKPPRPDI